MSIQIFSPLTANKNSSKVITAAEESSSPPRGRKERGEGWKRRREHVNSHEEDIGLSDREKPSRGSFTD